METNAHYSSYAAKRVLVTGHTGFKGSWLAMWLSQVGAEVLGYSLDPPSTPSHFAITGFNGHDVRADICDRDRLTCVVREFAPEIVFHLAAQPLVRESYRQPARTYEVNVIGTMNLLEVCRQAPSVRAIVCVTTDKVYHNREWPHPYRENDELGGHDPYSCSKACAELVAASFRSSFWPLDQFGKTHHTLLATVRAGNVIGGGDWASDRLIPDIVRATIQDKSVEIRSPHSVRPWQHVLECLNGYLMVGTRLLNGDHQAATAWNFGPTEDGHVEVGQVASEFRRVWPKTRLRIASTLSGPHEAQLLKLECSKARSSLQWHPVWSWQEAVSRTARWYRCYYENGECRSQDDLLDFVQDLAKTRTNSVSVSGAPKC